MRTPAAVTPEILDFCNRINNAAQPVLIPIRPAASSQQDNCFGNVAAVVARDKGEIVHGWRIVEWPGAFLEAAFHAVWRGPDGALVDVSPCSLGQSTSLFLPQPEKQFDGTRTESRKFALTTDMRVHDFIGATAEWERVTGNVIGENRIRVTPEIQALRQQLQELMRYMVETYRR